MIDNVDVSDDWLARWDAHDWRDIINAQLRSIIWNRDTAVADRLTAMKLLHDAVHAELLPPDPSLAETSLAVLIALSRGSFETSFWRRIGLPRRQRALSERLCAVQSTLLTASTLLARRTLRSAFTPKSDEFVS